MCADMHANGTFCCLHIFLGNDFSLTMWNQVRQLLVHDPGNSEYADMEKELSEVTLMIVCFYIVLSCKIIIFELCTFSRIMSMWDSPPLNLWLMLIVSLLHWE